MSARVALSLACTLVACTPPKKEAQVPKEVKIVEAENAPERLFEKGKAFHAVGDLVRAEQYYAAALQQGAPENQVLPLLLRVCTESKRFQVAIEYAEPALKKNPKNHRLRLTVAALYRAVGQNEKARSEFELVLATVPDDAIAHYALAVLLRDEFFDRVGADKHFREYLRLAPEGPHAEEAKGSLLKEVSPASDPPPAPSSAPGSAPNGDPPKPVTKPNGTNGPTPLEKK